MLGLGGEGTHAPFARPLLACRPAPSTCNAARPPQVYLILDEFICGGEIQETAKKVSSGSSSTPLGGLTATHRTPMRRHN